MLCLSLKRRCCRKQKPWYSITRNNRDFLSSKQKDVARAVGVAAELRALLGLLHGLLEGHEGLGHGVALGRESCFSLSPPTSEQVLYLRKGVDFTLVELNKAISLTGLTNVGLVRYED